MNAAITPPDSCAAEEAGLVPDRKRFVFVFPDHQCRGARFGATLARRPRAANWGETGGTPHGKE